MYRGTNTNTCLHIPIHVHIETIRDVYIDQNDMFQCVLRCASSSTTSASNDQMTSRRSDEQMLTKSFWPRDFQELFCPKCSMQKSDRWPSEPPWARRPIDKTIKLFDDQDDQTIRRSTYAPQLGQMIKGRPDDQMIRRSPNGRMMFKNYAVQSALWTASLQHLFGSADQSAK